VANRIVGGEFKDVARYRRPLAARVNDEVVERDPAAWEPLHLEAPGQRFAPDAEWPASLRYACASACGRGEIGYQHAAIALDYCCIRCSRQSAARQVCRCARRFSCETYGCAGLAHRQRLHRGGAVVRISVLHPIALLVLWVLAVSTVALRSSRFATTGTAGHSDAPTLAKCISTRPSVGMT
jgi:hypothetical protein